MAGDSPTIKRRRLSHTLRRLRRESGLSVTEVGKRLEWDPSKVSRIERNEWRLPSLRDVRDLLDLYGVTDEAWRDELLSLAREARQHGWWEKYQDVFRSSLPDFEAGASTIRTWQLVLIPGLLQTEEYARAIGQAGHEPDDELVERHVQAKRQRQRILDRDDPPTLTALIDEAALRKRIGGPAVMQKQLHHLIEMATRANITIQILPDHADAHPAMEGAFVILDFDDDPGLVYTATVTDCLWLDKANEYQRYDHAFARTRELVLSPDDSSRRMVAMVEQFT